MTVMEKIDAPRRVKLTVQAFETLERSGTFDNLAKTELIDGVIYAVNAQFVAHALAKTKFARRLGNALEAIGSELVEIVEATVAISPVSAPEPDIVAARAAAGTRAFLPVDAVALAVEIADSTAWFDLGEKAALYAQSGVPEYWVVDLQAHHVVLHWQPTDSAYAEQRTLPFGTPIESITIPGLVVESDGLI